jgi:chorismate mutase/prephenate dehydratase
MNQTELNKLRTNIDAVDEKLVELFNQRARYVLEIGRFKQANQLPVYEPKREAVVMANIARCNEGPLPDEELAAIYTAILAAMRRL